MTAYTVVTKVVLPAGEYWVGDPCYAVPNDRWMEWLEAADYTNDKQNILLAELDGKPVIGISTAYGDGTYFDQHGNSYPVDAGLLGLTPVEIAEGEPFGSRKVTFTQDIECEYDEGKIILGSIVIDTDPEDHDPYGYYYDEDEDDDDR